jgi:polysaccharide export outer membrane protein
LRIGSGDLLELGVLGAPEFAQQVRVGAAGDVGLPFIGAVSVRGLTARDAAALIARKLVEGGFYKQPQVSVFIKEYATQGVSVLGEVNKPGVYPRLGARRLFDMISEAGGYAPKAGKLITVTRRDDPQHPVTIHLSSDADQKARNNVEIMPGDTIMVETAGVVYVIGDVAKPSGFLMDNDHLTVLQAIALAGGTNQTAALGSAKVVRKSAEQMQEIPVPLKKILQAKERDLPLESGDILFVPTSTGKSVGRRSLEAIVQAATGLAIYGGRY